MKKLFTKHPASVDETYGEHMAMAASFGARMFVASIACFVHAVFPFLFERTGSKAISELYARMVTHRHKPTRGAHGHIESGSRVAASSGR